MSSRKTICSVGILGLALVVSATADAQSTGVPWRNNVDAAKIEAAQSDRLVLLHFWSRTCGPCRVLDQTVFNQPHVGAALEREFVPIKIDLEAAPALQSQYRIDQVPTDVVLSPQGELVAKLSCPTTAEAYLAQLQALSRHFRQSAPGAKRDPQQGTVNAAYANLPTARPAGPTVSTPAAVTPPMGLRYGAPQAPSTPAGATPHAVAQQPAPQSQTNPYVAPAPAAGQAQAVYRQAANPAVANPAAAVPGQTPAAAITPPANAMPRSYQTSLDANRTAGISSAPVQPVVPPTNAPANPSVPASTAPYTAAGIAPPRAATPWVPQLPPGAPPAGLEGYCPVTLKSLRKWAPGNPAFGVIHRGRTYLFASPRERDQFLADPDAYAPVFAGYDPVLLLEKRQSVPGSRKFGYEFDGRFYLFSSKETMDKFGASPEIARTYASGVRQAMNRIDSAAGGPVRR
jgi:protein disulfide-isomerase